MADSNPDCTCPPKKLRLPHRADCPRYDEDRAWSIGDRSEWSVAAGVQRCPNCAPGYDCARGIYAVVVGRG